MEARDFLSAVTYLNSRKAFPAPSLNEMRGSDDMGQWLGLIGHSIEQTTRLQAIHVSGTNGKGSVCVFVAALLQAYSERVGYPLKIGLYTSPHLKTIRERIRINGDLVTEECFAERFFQVWESLPAEPTPKLDIPRYLQLLALISIHHFLEEEVDVAIFETHLGGEYDATNIISGPIITAVTSIGLDHVRLLGPTVEDIAWHKAGIFKHGTRAFSVPQAENVSAVLQQRAGEARISLKFVEPLQSTEMKALAKMPDVQKQNLSLALAVVRAWLNSNKITARTNVSLDDVVRGIRDFSWPGRFQILSSGKLQIFLDGAHNETSAPHAVEWYAKNTLPADGSRTSTRILLYSHLSERDGKGLLGTIARSLFGWGINMDYVILTSYKERQDGSYRIERNLGKRCDMGQLQEYSYLWREVDASAQISVRETIEEALDEARKIASETGGAQALVVGSLHLVSGVLCLLEPGEAIYRND